MNSDAVADRFPIRPALREGESVNGWCLRTYFDNGHVLPAKAGSALLAIRSVRVLEPDDALSQLFGFQKLKAMYDRENSILHPWAGQPPPRSDEAMKLPMTWYRLSFRSRFCAQCLADVKCHLVYWDLPLVSACAVHCCHLNIRCHACRGVLSWVSLKSGWRCKCGADISAGESKRAPLQAVRFSRDLCAASDAQVPQTHRAASYASNPIRLTYRTRDVYVRAFAANDAAKRPDQKGLRFHFGI